MAAGRHERPAVPSAAIKGLLDLVEDRDRPIAAMLVLGCPADETAITLAISARELRARP